MKLILNLMIISVVIASCKNDKSTEIGSRVEVLPYYNDPTFTPKWLDKDALEIESFHTIPDFSFINQDGDSISEKTFEDKIYVTDFFFATCPGICPKMAANMVILQKAFKDDSLVLLLSHSVTPRIDSVAVLHDYAENYNIDSSKWHLATGNRDEIYNLGRNFYYVEESLGLERTDDDFLHTENFVLIDRLRHIRGIYNGLNKTSIQQLIEDIEALKKEGS